MNTPVYGNLTFDAGWKTKTNITFFGNNYNIIVKAKAYFEKDGITKEQEESYDSFKSNRSEHLNSIEKILNETAGDTAPKRFIPRTLLFQRDGGYALLLDDNEDEDGGIAVSLAPNFEVLSQDEYL